MDLLRKLEILADAAKYDASCAGSGAARKDSRGSQGVGSTGGAGIYHSYLESLRRKSKAEAGAAAMHVKVGDPFKKSVPALSVLALCIIIIAGHWPGR